MPVAAPVIRARLPEWRVCTRAPYPLPRAVLECAILPATGPRGRRAALGPTRDVAEYRTESLPDACVIEARGEVDISNVAELTRRVLHALADGETAIVLDLSGVTHLD